MEKNGTEGGAMSNPAFADIGACVFDAYGTLFDVAAAARFDVAFHQSILESCGGDDLLPVWIG